MFVICAAAWHTDVGDLGCVWTIMWCVWQTCEAFEVEGEVDIDMSGYPAVINAAGPTATMAVRCNTSHGAKKRAAMHYYSMLISVCGTPTPLAPAQRVAADVFGTSQSEAVTDRFLPAPGGDDFSYLSKEVPGKTRHHVAVHQPTTLSLHSLHTPIVLLHRLLLQPWDRRGWACERNAAHATYGF